MSLPTRAGRTSPLFLAGTAVVATLGLWVGLSLGEWRAPTSDVTAEVEGRQVAIVETTTPAPSTTADPTTTTSLEPLRVAQLAFTGDTLAHRGVVRQARTYATEAEVESEEDSGAEYDFSPMFDRVERYLASADVAICHLETPLSPDNTSLSGYPTFNVPRELADGLASAGYDGCTTASNHSLDRRAEGVDGTLDVLDAAGLQHSGMARSQQERETPTIYDANGISVANISYSYGFNGFSTPADEPWRANLIDPDVILADAAAAKAAGAEYVVASLHWGTEYRHEPNEEQREVAEALAGRPVIDLIIGHHAHVVQPIEELDGTTVVFGLGNFLSNQSAICCAAGAQDGAIAVVDIVEIERASGGSPARFETTVSVVETWVDRDDFTILPVADVLEDEVLAGTNLDALTASLERTQSVMFSVEADSAD